MTLKSPWLRSLPLAFSWTLLIFQMKVMSGTGLASLLPPAVTKTCNISLTFAPYSSGYIIMESGVEPDTTSDISYCVIQLFVDDEQFRIRLTFQNSSGESDLRESSANENSDSINHKESGRNFELKDELRIIQSRIINQRNNGHKDNNKSSQVQISHSSKEDLPENGTNTTQGRLQSSGTFDESDCDHNYIHIGNNMHAIDIESLSSFKICTKYFPYSEFVSRGSSVWIVERSSTPSKKDLIFFYEVLPEVPCKNISQFPCSSVQCIERDLVCDGIQQCSNGRDEYCGVPPEGDSCFLCFDGRCIHPELPEYSPEKGKKWWWLCDDYPHCLDSTDEIQGICLGLQSRSNELFECNPHESNSAVENSSLISILTTQLCDGLSQCKNDVDERHPKCFPVKGEPTLKPEIVYIPLIAMAAFCTVMFFLGKYCDKRDRHPETSLTNASLVEDREASLHSHTESSSTLPSRSLLRNSSKKTTWKPHPVTEV